ncbi:modification methylase haeiiI [Caudoviricetes sp.]|nr:modification methylase haeiiI [Caudoviricetes sp.]UOF82783.1 modification methylase haeiiI [Caudoviricetes sp.]
MKAVAVHTYMGGMQLGVSKVTEVITSLESWEDAMEARELAALTYDDVPRYDSLKDWTGSADFVFANPPCARFSVSAARTYSSVKKADLGEFCELQDVCGITQQSGAKMMWWETGPMLWTKGRDMVYSIHEYMARWWGSCTTLVVKVDARSFGVPQKRPRCHAIHCAGDFVPIIDPRETPWPLEDSAFKWLAKQMRSRWDYRFSPSDAKDEFLQAKPNDCWGDPVKYCRVQDVICTFGQGKPQIFSINDPYLPVVLSGRLACWEELNRWISIEEWAAFMTMPPRYARAIAEELGAHKTLQLLSKGVCSDVSQRVAEQFAIPMTSMTGTLELEESHRWKDGVWGWDASVKDSRKRKFGQGRQGRGRGQALP